VYYEPGQEYNPHHDWWVQGEQRADESKELTKSRFLTFLLYLNDPASPTAGGRTKFPKCPENKSLSLHPGKGGAAFFYNLLGDGNPDDLSMHAAEVVREGEKWFANVWIWDPHM
jgi:prolyl 4-hydroxylase